MRAIIENLANLLLGKVLTYKIRIFLSRLLWLVNRPKYPPNHNNENYIHLGCGGIKYPGFINIDVRYLSHLHHVSSIENLPMFKNNFADLIYASHCLEHISHNNIDKVLKEWQRVLKSGGICRISVPDFDTIVKIYDDNNKDADYLQRPLMGTQDYKYNYHYTCFSQVNLTNRFIQAGFREVRNWEFGTEKYTSIPDWSGKKLTINNIEYNISLNIEAVK